MPARNRTRFLGPVSFLPEASRTCRGCEIVQVLTWNERPYLVRRVPRWPGPTPGEPLSTKEASAPAARSLRQRGFAVSVLQAPTGLGGARHSSC